MLFINIGSVEATILIAIPVLLILYALVLIIKSETGIPRILWILFVVFVPLIAALIYLVAHFISHRGRKRSLS